MWGMAIWECKNGRARSGTGPGQRGTADRSRIGPMRRWRVWVLAGLSFYGKAMLARPTEPKEYLRVSVVQGNIPQSVKWELMAKEKILEI